MTTYDRALDDDEWREINFSTVAIESAKATGARQPTADELIAAAKRFGPEGILESAILLRQFEYKRVEEALQKLGTK